jgi:antitoxin CptB
VLEGRRQAPSQSYPSRIKPMTEDVDTRRRRAAYRAWHRGTKEMDLMLGRFADSALAGMSPETLARFERLLALPDPDLQDMLLNPALTAGPEALADLIARVRAFHGLD